MCFLSILLGTFAKAETHYILMDGGTSLKSNYYRFYNAMRRGYETSKYIGKEPKIIAKDGVWLISKQHAREELELFALTPEGKKENEPTYYPKYPPISSSARSGEDIESIIQKSSKSGDTVFLYITPHGFAPKNPKKPETAELGLWGKRISYIELKDILAKFPEVKFKLTTTACYAGGIHYLSRELKNTCTSSIVPYFNSSSSGDFHEYPFDVSFWTHIQKTKGKTSFAEANLEGFASQNKANPLQASLSSFDYVDFILKKAQHEKVFPEGRYNRLEENWLQVETPDGYKSVFEENLILSTEKKIPQSLEAGVCHGACFSSGQADLRKVTKLIEDLNEAVKPRIAEDLDKKLENQPLQVQTIFHQVIEDMKKNGDKYIKTAKKYENEYKDLLSKWNEKKALYQNKYIGSVVSLWKEEGESRAEFQQKFDVLKSDAERDLRQYFFNHAMLSRLERLEEFTKKASVEQKKKFLQLLQCEWEPL